MDLGQKTQNNEFVESGLENRGLMNQTGTQVDLDDKRMQVKYVYIEENRSWKSLRRSVHIYFSQVRLHN